MPGLDENEKASYVTSQPLFKWIVLGDFALILLFGIGMGWCAGATQPSSLQRDMYNDLQKAFFMTLGAFLGLIGGKSADFMKVASS